MASNAAKKKSPGLVELGEPVGKWAEVLAETRAAGRAIEPFQVTESLTLYPPTPERAHQIKVASWAHTAASAAAINAAAAGATHEEMNEIRERLATAEMDYNKALFGADEYPRVVAYFDSRPDWERNAFVDAVKSAFLRLPKDGKCPTCKQVVDAEQAGNVDASSDTSTGTGTTSNPTSPSTSEDATPVIGVAG